MHRTVVVMSQADYDGMQETLHLLSSPKNAQRLLSSPKNAQRLLKLIFVGKTTGSATTASYSLSWSSPRLKQGVARPS
jgi:hypothetical protein